MPVVFCSWGEVSQAVKEVNNDFFTVLDACKELKQHKLAIYEYSYGETVADNDYFYAPKDSGIEPIKRVPFSMILEKSMEKYVNFPGKCFCFEIMQPGGLLQVTSFAKNDTHNHPDDMLTFTAGARNIFLLPKIASAKAHQKLSSHFNLAVLPPKNLKDHFDVFKGITDAVQPDWKFRLLVFPEKFMKYLYEQENHPIAAYVREFSLNANAYNRNMMLYDFILSYIKNEFKISTNDFVNETVRQILCIASGQIPAYSVINSEELAPYKIIEQAYLEIYKLEKAPIIMAPKALKPFTSEEPVYYSMKQPGFIYSAPPTNSTLRSGLMITAALKQYCEQIQKAQLAKNTIFYQSSKLLDVNVIHDTEGLSQEKGFIKPQVEILNYDRNFQASMARLGMSADTIPSRSTLFNGCFGIRYKK